jgi:hypothetical protein
MTVAGVTIARSKFLMQKAALLVAMAQILVGVGPLLEVDIRDAYSHVETTGVQLHYSHDDAACAACVIRQMLGSAEPAQLPPILAVAKPIGDVVASSARRIASPRHLRNSRAPPQSA